MWRFTLCVYPIRLDGGSRFYSSIKLAIHICKIKDLQAKVIIHFLGTFWIQSIINLMLISKETAKIQHPSHIAKFISYVLLGSSATLGSNEYYNQAMLSACQLNTFNTLIRTWKDSSSSYHPIFREPALYV